jgi:hypothetical protein
LGRPEKQILFEDDNNYGGDDGKKANEGVKEDNRIYVVWKTE